MTLKDIQTKVKKEIETLAQTDVRPDQELFQSGLLDSLNIINILSFIESEFGISIAPFDITLETFNTIDSISNYIQEKTL